MVDLLELPEVRRQVSRLSVEFYEQWGKDVGRQRTELIRGLILWKVTASPFHSFLIAQLRSFVQDALEAGQHCRQEQPLRLVDSMPEPDLAVVSGRATDYRRAHPTTALLAMEVAVSSVALDREKAALYAEAGVPEYWIVLADTAAIEVYTAPVAGRYTRCQTYTVGETVVSATLPALSVRLDTLFTA